MTVNKTNKLVWIIDTIRRNGKISFEDLNSKWQACTDLSEGKPMSKRTFHKWKDNIYTILGIDIVCEKNAPYLYYIEDIDEIKKGSIENWLLNTYSVSNSLIESKAMKDRILLEEVPSGRAYLQPIIEAMRTNHWIHIAYCSYWENKEVERYIMPLCVKLFRQRWYVVGMFMNHATAIFCLDRIRNFRMSSHTFTYPEDFLPELYFRQCFGIINSDRVCCEHVVLKIQASQTNYMRDLPLHASQQETYCGKDYSIFELDVKPTYDFMQEILWMGTAVEVLEPESFRREIADEIKQMAKQYKPVRNRQHKVKNE